MLGFFIFLNHLCFGVYIYLLFETYLLLHKVCFGLGRLREVHTEDNLGSNGLIIQIMPDCPVVWKCFRSDFTLLDVLRRRLGTPWFEIEHLKYTIFIIRYSDKGWAHRLWIVPWNGPTRRQVDWRWMQTVMHTVRWTAEIEDLYFLFEFSIKRSPKTRQHHFLLLIIRHLSSQ